MAEYVRNAAPDAATCISTSPPLGSPPNADGSGNHPRWVTEPTIGIGASLQRDV